MHLNLFYIQLKYLFTGEAASYFVAAVAGEFEVGEDDDVDEKIVWLFLLRKTFFASTLKKINRETF